MRRAAAAATAATAAAATATAAAAAVARAPDTRPDRADYILRVLGGCSAA